jgi:hypothetical protein
MTSQSVDAVNEQQGLRLDNLEFGIVDGSGRRLRIMVRNEEHISSKDTQVETIEFVKSSSRPEESKTLGVCVGTHQIEENTIGLEQGTTPVEIVENVEEDREEFSGMVDLDFQNEDAEVTLN